MSLRQKSIDALEQILKENVSTAKFNNLDKVAQCIETSCYNATIFDAKGLNMKRCWGNPQFLDLYQSKIYRVSINLDESSPVINNTLGKRIANILRIKELYKVCEKKFDSDLALKICKNINTFNLNNIGYMSSDKLNPLSNSKEQDIIRIRGEQQIIVKISRLYVCSKCGEKKSKIYKTQSRSADEGYTFSIECVNCGNIRHEYG